MNILSLILGVYIVLSHLPYSTVKQLYLDIVLNNSPSDDPLIYLAIIKQESGGNPFAIGVTGDYGLMQITQPALTDYNNANHTNYTLYDMLMNPKKNIAVGVFYYNWLFGVFGGDRIKALSAYNQGIGNVQRNNYSTNYAINVLNKYEDMRKGKTI